LLVYHERGRSEQDLDFVIVGVGEQGGRAWREGGREGGREEVFAKVAF